MEYTDDRDFLALNGIAAVVDARGSHWRCTGCKEEFTTDARLHRCPPGAVDAAREKALHSLMPPRPLSPTTQLILAYLAEHPGATPTTVARELRLNFNTVHSAMLRHKKRTKQQEPTSE